MSQIAKNTFYLTIASVLQKFLSFIYFTILARFLGVDDIGLYATVLSFTGIFLIFVDLGFTPVLIREGSQDKEKINEKIGQTILAKLAFGLIAFFCLMLIIYFIRGHYNNPLEFQKLIAIMGIMMILNSFSTTFYGALRSFQKLRYEAVGIIISQVVIIIAGLLFLWWRKSLVLLFLALGLGDVFAIGYALFVLNHFFQVKPVFYWNAILFKRIFIAAIPFALAGIFTRVYSFVDHILISYLISVREVGFYSISSKVVFAFQFIPLSFAAALYPAMSYFFVHDQTRLKKVFEKGLFYLSIIALPIIVGLIVIADIFVTKVYGAVYAPSILPLQILAASLFFVFLDFPVGSILNACHLQKIQTTAMGITMVVNIVLNLALLPFFSIKGAAVAALLSNATLFFFGYFYVSRIIKPPEWSFWFRTLRIFFSALLMGLLVFCLKIILPALIMPTGFIHSLIFISILIFAGGLFYLVFLWIFQILKKTELDDFLSIVKRK